MTSFAIGNVSRWSPVVCSGAYTFELPACGFRVVNFDVICSQPLEVWCSSDGGDVLIAAGAGFLALKFTINEESSIEFRWADKPGQASWRTLVEPMTVPSSDEPSYTNLEPREAGMSAEIIRMMRIMELNAEQREKRLREHVERLEREAKKPKPKSRVVATTGAAGDEAAPAGASADSGGSSET